MIQLIQFLLTLVTTSVLSRLSLQAENAALRNQLSLYRKSGQRPSIRPADRLLWCFIAKFWAGWRTALYFVQPRTVTTWQKKLFRDYWRALSQSAKPGRPRISRELRKQFGAMGWTAYRLATDEMAHELANVDPSLTALRTRIKKALDPNGVVSPGRYEAVGESISPIDALKP